MTEPERRAAELRTLLAWIAHQRAVVRRVEERLDRAEARVGEGTDPELVAATALFLQHFYTAIEDTLVRIAERLDGSAPSGEEGHRLLLDQMALDIPEVRPAVLTPEIRRHLDVLRRFRHRARHAYDEDYDWHRMGEPLAARAQVTELLPAFFKGVGKDLRRIISALEEAAG